MEETGSETDKTLSKQSWDSKKVRAAGRPTFFLHVLFNPSLEANSQGHVEIGTLLSYAGTQALTLTAGLSD